MKMFIQVDDHKFDLECIDILRYEGSSMLGCVPALCRIYTFYTSGTIENCNITSYFVVINYTNNISDMLKYISGAMSLFELMKICPLQYAYAEYMEDEKDDILTLTDPVNFPELDKNKLPSPKSFYPKHGDKSGKIKSRIEDIIYATTNTQQ